VLYTNPTTIIIINTIGLPEFIMFMRAQKTEAEARLKDMIEVPIMVEEGEVARAKRMSCVLCCVV
jgi:hypothetical protein